MKGSAGSEGFFMRSSGECVIGYDEGYTGLGSKAVFDVRRLPKLRGLTSPYPAHIKQPLC